MKRKSAGDVLWWGKGKKPIAYSTTATKDLIQALYEEYKDFRKYSNIFTMTKKRRG